MGEVSATLYYRDVYRPHTEVPGRTRGQNPTAGRGDMFNFNLIHNIKII